MKEREILLYNSLKGLHLLSKAPKQQVVGDLLGLQAQFSRNPQYSLWLRAEDYAPETWDEGLVKLWSHRGTMHVVPAGEIGLHICAMDRRAPYGDVAPWMGEGEPEKWSAFIVEQIRGGNHTRDGLKSACLAAGMSEDTLKIAFHGWGGLIRDMCYAGRIVLGTGTEKTYFLPPETAFMPRDEARKIMLRRYFEHFGPATLADMRHFFTGWRWRETGPLLEEVLPELMKTEIGGETYYHARPLVMNAELPECVLVPGFDQLVLGYKDRSRMVDDAHKGRVVNAQGIVFPVVIVRGRMRAAWKIEGDKVKVTPFGRLLRKDEAAIRREVKKKLAPAVKKVEFT